MILLIFWELLYADDTLVISKSPKYMQLILKEIEAECIKYNMSLNKTKCEIIAMNAKPKILFEDKTKVKIVDKARHLGAIITKKANRETDLENRLSIARATATKLRTFWRKVKVSKIWKLQVYNAIVVSQLIYAFDSLHLTDTCKRKLDAFHMRGLRYVFDVLPAFVSKISNKKVLEMANKTLFEETLETLKPDIFLQYMEDRRYFKPEDLTKKTHTHY